MGQWGKYKLYDLKEWSRKADIPQRLLFQNCHNSSSGRTFNQLENLGFGNTQSWSYHLHYRALKISLLTCKTKVKMSTTQHGYKALDNLITQTKKSETPKETSGLFYHLQKNYFDFLQLKIRTEILEKISVTCDHMGSSSDIDLCRQNRKWEVLRILKIKTEKAQTFQETLQP